MIPVKAVLRFTQGDCWMLALSISELTGWPVMICDYHAVVKTPRGKLLDIQGLHKKADLEATWQGGPFDLAPSDKTDAFWHMWGVTGYRDWRSAKRWAKRVLKLYMGLTYE